MSHSTKVGDESWHIHTLFALFTVICYIDRSDDTTIERLKSFHFDGHYMTRAV